MSGDQPACLEGGLIQIYNLSSGNWIDSYDPNRWSSYSVPTAVQKTIGGSAAGGASQVLPPGGFANESMTALFGTAYNSSKMTTWYPYPATPTSYTGGINAPSVVHQRRTSKYLRPILAGAAGLGLLVALILLWRFGVLKRLPKAFRIAHWARYNIAKHKAIDKLVEVDGEKPVYEVGTDHRGIHEMRVYELPGNCNLSPPEYTKGFDVAGPGKEMSIDQFGT